MHLILLSGKAGCGKTTIQKELEKELTARDYTCQVANFADLLKYVCKNFCGWNGVKDDGGRALLQVVGTDIVRERDDLFWVNFIKNMIEFFGDVYDFMIIGDARFPNEIDYFKKGHILNLNDVISVRIERELLPDCNISAANSTHSSETSLDDYNFDLTVTNYEGRPSIATKSILKHVLKEDK